MASATNSKAATPMVGPLTPMMFEVLLGVAEGESCEDTARRLYLSENTVKSHRRRIYKRLGATNAAHAVDIGYRAGLLDVARGGVIE
jgi:DNA-binding CsgD family transcriptional regulator